MIMSFTKMTKRVSLICTLVLLLISGVSISYGAENFRASGQNVGAKQGHVEHVSVDNSDLSNCVVTYNLNKGEISTATFTSPSNPNGITKNVIGSGNFHFSFNQNDLVGNKATFTLKYTLKGATSSKTLPFTATIKYFTKTAKKSASTFAWRGSAYLQLVTITHHLRENYRKVYYDIPMTETSKHTWVGIVDTKVDGEHGYDLPDFYSASHQFEETGVKFLQHTVIPIGGGAGFPVWGGANSIERGIRENEMLPNRGALFGKTEGSFDYMYNLNYQPTPSLAMATQLNPITVHME